MSAAPSQPRRVVALDVGYADYDRERAVLRPLDAALDEVFCEGDLARTVEAVRNADAVMLREAPLPALVIGQLERCQVIVRYGVGVDNVDLDAAAARKIYVANVPDYGVDEVSLHALALLLAVARRIASRDRDVRAGAWNIGAREAMYRLAGGTLGLIGYGRIGESFHRKTVGLDFTRTLVADPALTAPPPGAELASLEEVCRQADVISLHAPLLPQTRHIIDAARLSLMKPTAILVNASRGGLIDEAALAEALSRGRLHGAGLDVFEQEPPPADHPLLRAPNVVVSDHTAWYSEASVGDLQRKAAEEVARVFQGLEPRNWVNRWDGA